MLASTYDAVRSILGDLRFSADVTRPGFPIEGHIGGKVDVFARSLIRQDEPEHSRLRKVVAEAFRPNRVAAFAAEIQGIVDGCLLSVRRAGAPADLVALYTSEVPSLTICRFLGIDESLRPTIKRLALSAGEPPMAGGKHALERIADVLGDYLGTVTPDAESPSLFGSLVAAVARGEITQEELVSMAVLLTLGGHETTANTLALGIARILADRDLYDRLIRQPDQIPAVAEEIVRVNSVVRAGPRRVAVEDVVVAGELVRKGTGVILALHAANHDDAFVQQAAQIQPGRERARSHMAFGFGLHQCLGQFLARQELTIALSALLAGFEELRLAGPAEELTFFGEAGIYGIRELKVVWRDA
jgi:cytochrome P450